MMYLITIKCKEKQIELLTKNEITNDNISEILIANDLISNEDIINFYSNMEEYIKKNVTYKKEKAVKKIFYLNNHIKGYGTYRAAIVCAYTKNEAKNIILEKSDQFRNCEDITLIGIALETTELGTIITDYFNG